jgi:hypothetical protein
MYTPSFMCTRRQITFSLMELSPTLRVWPRDLIAIKRGNHVVTRITNLRVLIKCRHIRISFRCLDIGVVDDHVPNTHPCGLCQNIHVIGSHQ